MASRSKVVSIIKEEAAARGIDEDVAVRLADKEGLKANPAEAYQSFVGKGTENREESYGVFQLNANGIGAGFEEATGYKLNDPSLEAERARIQYALNHAAESGWGAWYGRNTESDGTPTIGRTEGLGEARVIPIAANEADSRVDPDVLQLQSWLNENAGASLAEDGIMGPATQAALNAYRASEGLPAVTTDEMAAAGFEVAEPLARTPTGEPYTLSPISNTTPREAWADAVDLATELEQLAQQLPTNERATAPPLVQAPYNPLLDLSNPLPHLSVPSLPEPPPPDVSYSDRIEQLLGGTSPADLTSEEALTSLERLSRAVAPEQTFNTKGMDDFYAGVADVPFWPKSVPTETIINPNPPPNPVQEAFDRAAAAEGTTSVAQPPVPFSEQQQNVPPGGYRPASQMTLGELDARRAYNADPANQPFIPGYAGAQTNLPYPTIEVGSDGVPIYDMRRSTGAAPPAPMADAFNTAFGSGNDADRSTTFGSGLSPTTRYDTSGYDEVYGDWSQPAPSSYQYDTSGYDEFYGDWSQPAPAATTTVKVPTSTTTLVPVTETIMVPNPAYPGAAYAGGNLPLDAYDDFYVGVGGTTMDAPKGTVLPPLPDVPEFIPKEVTKMVPRVVTSYTEETRPVGRGITPPRPALPPMNERILANAAGVPISAIKQAAFGPQSLSRALSAPASGGPNYDYVNTPSPISGTRLTYVDQNGNVHWSDSNTNLHSSGAVPPTSTSATSGSSGKVMCTHYRDLGWLPREIWAGEMRFALDCLSDETRAGYRLWATPLVSRMKAGDDRLQRLWWPVVKAWANEAAHRAGEPTARSTLLGKMIRMTFEPWSRYVWRSHLRRELRRA